MTTLESESAVFSQVRDAGHILVAIPERTLPQTCYTAVALAHGLREAGKTVTLASSQPPPVLKEEIQVRPTLQRDLVITFDETNGSIGNVHMERMADGRLRMALSPVSGQLQPADIHVSDGGYAVDLVITVDCPDLSALGTLYDPQLFSQIPATNMDTELVYTLLRTLGGTSWADLLLTSLYEATDSFRNAAAPETFLLAAKILSYGGKRLSVEAAPKTSDSAYGLSACAALSDQVDAWQRRYPLPLARLTDTADPDSVIVAVPFAQLDHLKFGPGPSDQYRVVIDAAQQLAQAAPNTLLIASGGHDPSGEEAEWQSAEKAWLAAGIDPTRIMREETSVDTFSQARFYPELIRQSGRRKAVLVVNVFQAYRALKLCRRAAPDIAWTVLPVLHKNWSDNAKQLLTQPDKFRARERLVIALSPILDRMKAN